MKQEKSSAEKSAKKSAAQSKNEGTATPAQQSEEAKSGCPHRKKCGGCQYSGLPYAKQLEIKEKKLRELLGKRGNIHPIAASKEPFYYRNKVTAAFGFRNGRIVAGTYVRSTHRIVEIDHCLIQNRTADRLIHIIRDLCVSFGIKAYDENSGRGLLRHVMVRTAEKTGECMVILVTVSPIFPGVKNFIGALLKKCPEVSTVIQNINSQRTSMVLGPREKILYGKGYIEDLLCGLKFRISSSSFFQVNPVQTELLYQKAVELGALSGKESVLDAYCGVGAIGMIAAKSAKEVIGVELNAEAVRDANANARRNQIKNISFYANDAGVFLEDLTSAGKRLDVIFMDPPRTGSSPAFIESVCRAAPGRVVYISCNPETLARDLDAFARRGYRAQEIFPFDNFPLTEHVETVVLMSHRLI